jgi:peptidoglycan pentaglycine glycine transferase (the first glycine)
MGGWTTLLVDVGRDDDEILATFRAETRRAIRQSQRHGIEVRVEDTPAGWATLSSLQAELRRRAPVPELDQATLTRIGRAWMSGGVDGGGGAVLVARHDGQPLAAALVIVHGATAYLPVIPSAHGHDKLPASHLLVWEAMRWARAHGCTTFDLVGYSMMARPGESLWGINQFKRGFASLDHLNRTLAIHEKICSPAVCALASAERRAEALLRLRTEGPPR